MAKSTRSKVKRAYRAKKREDGVYAASEAARLKRLSSKLKGVAEEDAKEIVGLGIEEAETSVPAGDESDANDVYQGPMEVDGPSSTVAVGKISTHGPRGSRREDWRLSKGMKPSKSSGMNRQGGLAAKRRAGRAHRRR